MRLSAATLLFLFSFVVGFDSNAYDDGDEHNSEITERTARNILTEQGIDKVYVNRIITALSQGPTEGAESGLSIKGGWKGEAVLHTSGLNAAFGADSDWWTVDAILEYGQQTVKVPGMYNMYFQNGGFNIEFSYKHIWIFLPKYTNLESLDGARFGGRFFGRGLQVGTSVLRAKPLFFQAGWVERIGGNGNAYIVAVGIEALDAVFWSAPARGGNFLQFNPFAGGSITFPAMHFQQRRVVPNVNRR